MTTRARRGLLWATVAVLLAGIAVPLWGPLGIAWRCYRIWADGERVSPELVRKLDDGSFALHLDAAPDGPTACTLRPPAALYEAARPGRTLEVVHVAERPGECVRVSTSTARRDPRADPDRRPLGQPPSKPRVVFQTPPA